MIDLEWAYVTFYDNANQFVMNMTYLHEGVVMTKDLLFLLLNVRICHLKASYRHYIHQFHPESVKICIKL